MSDVKPDSAYPWVLSQRASRMNSSIIREVLKLTSRPEVLSLAGGLPSPSTFPTEALAEACAKVLRDQPQKALQYAPTDGYAPLREWIAERMGTMQVKVGVDDIIITNGSQQGLDLLAKVLVDDRAPVAVEEPTYLGALQALTPYQPSLVTLACDDEGPIPEAFAEVASVHPLRCAYLIPTFQNPSGRLTRAGRREELIRVARSAGVPVIEDNPYGELWYDAPPPPPLIAHWPKGVVYLGSFSKVLAPGLRLGYVIAPPELRAKLLQAKQSVDLHTPEFNQRIVYEVVRDGFLDGHVAMIRERYTRQRDVMATALRESLPSSVEWKMPVGGMFFWLRLPKGLDAMTLLPRALEKNVAFVPGAPFFAGAPDSTTFRLSFVTLNDSDIRTAVARLADVIKAALEERNA